MSVVYNGLCPICQGQLYLIDGEVLECDAGDFQADEKEFSARWNAFVQDRDDINARFQKEKIRVSDLHIQSISEAESRLLTDLQGMNRL